MAYAGLQRWKPAAAAFEQAARRFETEQNGFAAAQLWVQSGNAALAGGDAVTARAALNAALASGLLKNTDAGEARLDRARAAYALGDSKAARTDLDAALKLVPDDPLAWLLSATAARREGNLGRAQSDIAEAAKRSPDDASVALEAGNIAIASGSEQAARTAWAAAIKNAPNAPAGQTAARLLAQLDRK
jgi:tetratricopeptide (TPR) repeat protein